MFKALIFCLGLFASLAICESRPTRVGHLKLSPSLDKEKFLAEWDEGGWLVISNQLIGVLDNQWLVALPLGNLSSPPTWSYKLDGLPSAPILSLGEQLLIATHKGHLLKIDAGTGQLHWTLDLTSVHRPMSLFGDSVFVVTSQEQVQRIDIKSGKTLWSYENSPQPSLPVNGGAPPAFYPHNREVLLGTSQGEIKNLHIDTGELKWSYFSEVASNARFKDVVGQIAITEDSFVYTRFDGIIESINFNSKALNWRQKDLTTDITASFSSRNILLVGSSNGAVFCLDLSDGKLLWKTQLVGAVRSLAITGDRIVVSTFHGILASLDIPLGNVQWIDELNGTLSAPFPFYHDQKSHFVTQSGNVYIYQNP